MTIDPAMAGGALAAALILLAMILAAVNRSNARRREAAQRGPVQDMPPRLSRLPPLARTVVKETLDARPLKERIAEVEGWARIAAEEALAEARARQAPAPRGIAPSTRKPAKMHAIPPGIIAGGLSCEIVLTYADAALGETENRRVTVRAIRAKVLKGGTRALYLQGYCHARRGPRMFRCDRIVEMTDLATGEVLHNPATILAWAAAKDGEGM